MISGRAHVDKGALWEYCLDRPGQNVHNSGAGSGEELGSGEMREGCTRREHQPLQKYIFGEKLYKDVIN